MIEVVSKNYTTVRICKYCESFITSITNNVDKPHRDTLINDLMNEHKEVCMAYKRNSIIDEILENESN